jgi:hypothetical protein
MSLSRPVIGLLYFTERRKLLTLFQWYNYTATAIPENSPLIAKPRTGFMWFRIEAGCGIL